MQSVGISVNFGQTDTSTDPTNTKNRVCAQRAEHLVREMVDMRTDLVEMNL